MALPSPSPSEFSSEKAFRTTLFIISCSCFGRTASVPRRLLAILSSTADILSTELVNFTSVCLANAELELPSLFMAMRSVFVSAVLPAGCIEGPTAEFTLVGIMYLPENTHITFLPL